MRKVLLGIIVLLLLAGGFFLFTQYTRLSSSEQNGEGNSQKNFWQQQGENVNNCSTAPAVFDHAVTTIAAISKITPGSATGDARYTYLWIKNNQEVPIFAPADGKLIKITYKVRTDLPPSMSAPDYDLAFQADCHTVYVINHVTNPIAQIVSTTPVTKPIELKPGSGVNDADTKPTQEIMVKAGEQIGTTTGTPAANNFDFGIFVDNQAVCPYEKFADPLKSSWLSLFGSSPCSVSGGL